MKNIPTKINNYNVYDEADRLTAMGEETALPDLEAMSETLAGPGILGEIDDPSVGHFSAMEMEIPFRAVGKESASMMDTTKARKLTLRGSMQTTNAEGDIEFIPMRVVVRGRAKKYTGGKVKNGAPMDGSVTVSITYFMVEVDGEQLIELDKLNGIYKVNGRDILEKVREMC